ncbi:hypothetical protein C8K36_1186 [Rhodococcus sp. OK519]|uniref:hypothetical protein n=1 Tax=Rhodococcus sp. OK519 TaxID=2135729 RepID=UPI000D34269D|nr:hypothetical protein C8K36_1186 [Rhodococcus sp. OK519]
MESAAVKFVLSSLFLVGVIVAGVGLVELHVHAAVAALIVASVSGLLLLRVRAESHGRLESRHSMMG